MIEQLGTLRPSTAAVGAALDDTTGGREPLARHSVSAGPIL
jgi:hypothetical protein